MTSLSRGGRARDLPSTKLLMRILERPGLVAAVRELPGAVLGKLIDRIGLEDAGELVALASTAQLERVFDDDLWRAERAGGDEAFRPERFALWLRVMAEAGETHLVRRLCELQPDLVALAVHRLVLVLDLEVLEEQLRPGDEEAEELERALADSAFEEWEEFRVIAREPDAWDDVWGALMSLDRDHHDRLRAILEQCCAMSTEYISGQGGLFQVLTAEEMLDSDVAAGREDRRGAEGFVSPADARAFLELARRGGGGDDARDPITRAYFRGLEKPALERRPEPKTAAKTGETPKPGGASTAAERTDLAALLREAEVVAPLTQPLPALTDGAEPKPHLVAPLFERAMSDLRQRDPVLFDARGREVGYLVNVWIAGGAHEGRRPRPVEALETVLKACEAGMCAQAASVPMTAEEALAVLAGTPADVLFRRGWGGSVGASSTERRPPPRRNAGR
jgi:hypothetical protein